MTPGGSSSLLEHGPLILYPLAGIAVAFALYLVFDGIRNWARNRQIAMLRELRRQPPNVIGPVSELHPPARRGRPASSLR